MRTQEQINEDYKTFRGKCKQMSEEMVRRFYPDLVLVKGHVFIPQWGREEAHWWTKDKLTGKIHDPSWRQFPSQPPDELYEEWDGKLYCCNCDKEGTEHDFIYLGSGDYFACSTECAHDFLGLS